MGKQNEKKIVREARMLTVLALGSLFESERQRRYVYKSKPGPKTRKTFCNKFDLAESTVTHIETGRMLGLKFSNMRKYIAAIRAKDDTKLLESLRKVYDGLKELDIVLENI